MIQTLREKFVWPECEKISQALAPFHAIPREPWRAAPPLGEVLRLAAMSKTGATIKQSQRGVAVNGGAGR